MTNEISVPKLFSVIILKIYFLIFCPFIHADSMPSELLPQTLPEEPTICMPGTTLSKIKNFDNVPMSDENGIVIKSMTLQIPGLSNVYNPSMIQTDFGYCVAYRYDFLETVTNAKKSTIGFLNVDEQFQPLNDTYFLEANDAHVEDPRIFFHDNKCYVSHTHVTCFGSNYLCNIGLSNIDFLNQKTIDNWDLLYKNGFKEKNWTPFSYTDKNGTSDLYFVYEYNPFKVIHLDTPITGIINHPFEAKPAPLLNEWEEKWGKIRGGTPALKLETGDYVTFFHSSFKEKGYNWYVVGAITFEGQPPFDIKSISQFPILFKGIYTTPVAQGRNKSLRALFPGGFTQDTLPDGKQVFNVICGENDSSVKVVTIDKELLLNSMNYVTQ